MQISLPWRERIRRSSQSHGVSWRRAKWAYIFLLPNLLLVFIFAFLPILAALYISFHEWSVLQPPRWVGFRNYLRIGGDETFLRSIWNTLYFLSVITPVRLVIGLLIALLLNQPLKLRSFFRTVTFMPWITSGVVVASIWLWLYNPEFGVLNYILSRLGMTGLYWYTDPVQAMPSIIIAGLWRSVGWVVIIYLAGLQGLPEEYYEAAQIDGASTWAQFRYITLPLLRPTTLLILITTMIGSFQMFDLVYVMTDGGPINSTTVMAHQIYHNAFTFLKMGYASAEAYVLFVIVLSLSLISFRWLRSDFV